MSQAKRFKMRCEIYMENVLCNERIEMFYRKGCDVAVQ